MPSSPTCELPDRLPDTNNVPGGRWGLWLGTGLGLSAAAVLFFYDPAVSAIYPPCPFHLLTGLHCPGCGSLRASHHLLHGELGLALRHNPLLVLAVPLLAYAWAAELRSLWGGRAWPRLPTGRRVLLGFLVVVGLFWLLRNLPWYPFTLLAP